MKRQISLNLLMISAAFAVSACGGGGSANNFVTAPSTGTGGGGSGSTGGTGGTISASGIYVSVVQQTQPVTTLVHQFYSYTPGCSIAANATGINDIQCMIDIRELDLYDQGLKLQFNTAAGMCDYVSDDAFSFYAAPAGFGPRSISIAWDQNAGTATCSVTNNIGTVLSSTVGGSGVTADATTGICTFPGGTATADGTVTSDYDYTASEGPNCTQGKYNFYGITTPPAAASAAPTVVSKSGTDWGGLIGNCMESPAKGPSSGWSVNSKYNLPVGTMHTGSNGFNQYYQITAPIKFNSVSNYYAANFFGWTNYAAGNAGAASVPTAISYSTDLLGNAVYSTTPAYTFTCYDTAQEVKQRVRVYINEWDQSTPFLNFIAGGSASTYSPVADLTQTCDFRTGDCDDYYGWSRYPTTFPGGDYNLKGQ